MVNLCDNCIAGLKKSSSIRKTNEKLVTKYIEAGIDIKLIIAVANAHIGLKKTDIKFLSEVNKSGRNILLVLNKADCVKKDDELREMVFKSKLAIQGLEHVLPAVHLTSCKTGFGISELGACLSTFFLITDEEEMAVTRLEQIAAGVDQSVRQKLLHE